MRLIRITTVLMLFAASTAPADEPKAKPDKKASLPTGTLSAKDWLAAATTPLKAGELDQLVRAELDKAKITPASRTTDEQFLRRVWLDVVGKLPPPDEITAFLKDTSSDKRAKVIDKLLDSDDYARHWGLYWRDVIATRVTDFQARLFVRQFEPWIVKQFKENKSWADTTRAMLTASGEMKYIGATDTPNGAAFFLLSRRGADATTERAAETSRVFLGIQIQCAQCHDHPFDSWKRPQFHEFAAYFGKLRERPIFEEKRIVGFALMQTPFGEYRMPGKDDPNPKKGGTPVSPRFLDGQRPAFAGGKMTDADRRKALADQITSKDNPWFAAAFVNRLWGELMGQAFYMPVDDLGESRDAVMPAVVARLSASFRGSDYNVKQLFRDVLNSEAYQRQIRPGESADEHLLFAASSPTRLNADALWQSLVAALGPLSGPGMGGFGKGPKGPKGAFGFGLEGVFRQEFAFDPSTRPDEVEGSIPQALILMNNPLIHQKIRATGNTTLSRILSAYSTDDEAVRAVYLKALARRPTDRELERCRQHIAQVNNRAEAFEDILWALINSTEFQTRR